MLRANRRGPAALYAWQSYPSRYPLRSLRPNWHVLISVLLREPLFREHRQINAGAHRLVAGVLWMQMIAGVEVSVEVRGVRRILSDLVEIDHAVKSSAGADPVIHRLTHLLALV